MSTKPLIQCLACGGFILREYLDLGYQPLANNFLIGIQLQETFPLCVKYCEDCSHSQLSVAVDPKILYSNYLYVSGTTETLKRHFTDLVLEIASWTRSDKNNLLELAANDGSLLKIAQEYGLGCLGVDPADNLKQAQQNNGVKVLTDFWTSETAFKVPGSYDNVVCLNVLAHNADPCDFLLGIKRIFNNRGYVIIEFPYFVNTAELKDFGQIYHEHHSYFTAKSFHALTERVGFVISRLKFFPKIHGGTYRFYLKIDGNVCQDFKDLYMQEKTENYHTILPYEYFADRIRKQVKELYQLLYNRQVVAYGASAKASTLLNYAPHLKKHIKYFVDDSPLKIGCCIPGTDLIIKSTDSLKEENELFVLCTVHNFKDEISKRLKDKGISGSIINYVPDTNIEDF